MYQISMLEMMTCLTIMIMMVMTLIVIMTMMLLMITKGIPSLAKSSFGPIPDSISSLGLPTTPALKSMIMVMNHDLQKIKHSAEDDNHDVDHAEVEATGLVMMTVIAECDD